MSLLKQYGQLVEFGSFKRNLEIRNWSPIKLPKLALWLDPLQNLSISDAIDSWSSFDNQYVFSASGDNRPSTSTINNITVPSFSGSNQFLDYSGQIINSSQGLAFFVISSNTGSGTHGIYSQSIGSTSNNYVSFLHTGSLYRSVIRTTSTSTYDGDTLLSLQPNIFTVGFDGTNIFMWVNKTLQSISISGDELWFDDVETSDISRIGGRRSSDSDVWDFNGEIIEIIIINVFNLKYVNRTFSYLNSKYNLQI